MKQSPMPFWRKTIKSDLTLPDIKSSCKNCRAHDYIFTKENKTGGRGAEKKNAVNDFDYALLSRTEFTRSGWEDVVLSITKGCCYLLLLCNRK